jgi:AcrR family transcriptional regulator
MSDTNSSLRERILGAAFSSFMRLGYAGTSTSQIARMAHVSKRDLYALFGSKQAMMTACVKEATERMRRPLTLPPPTSRAGLIATLVEYGAAFLPNLGRPEVLATFRMAILESEIGPELAHVLDQLGRQDTLTALSGLLTAACRQGLLHGGEPAEMGEFFMSMLVGNGLLIRMLMRLAEPPTEAEARQRAQQATERLLLLYGGPE